MSIQLSAALRRALCFRSGFGCDHRLGCTAAGYTRASRCDSAAGCSSSPATGDPAFLSGIDAGQNCERFRQALSGKTHLLPATMETTQWDGSTTRSPGATRRLG
jgi:hypothetical protein